MDTIKILLREFTSREPRKFKFKIGNHIASSLSGFVGGAVFASIVWLGTVWIMKVLAAAC